MHLIGWSKGKLCNGLVKGGVLSPITDICEMFKLRKRDWEKRLGCGDEWMWSFAFERLMTETE